MSNSAKSPGPIIRLQVHTTTAQRQFAVPSSASAWPIRDLVLLASSRHASRGRNWWYRDEDDEPCALGSVGEWEELLRQWRSGNILDPVAVYSEDIPQSASTPGWIVVPPSTTSTSPPPPSTSTIPTSPPQESFTSTLQFTLNGKSVTVENANPRMLLVEWLRYSMGMTGTKIGCGEGGCGACTVIMDDLQQVNACLFPLVSCHGHSITTVEGLSFSSNAIQQAIVQTNGTQCGYCTPGWVMAGTAVRAQKGVVNDGDLDGNLCRCTGYRPILDAMKVAGTGRSVAADIEDLGARMEKGLGCARKCAGKGGKESGGACSGKCESSAMGRFVNGSGDLWYRPTTLEDLQALQAQYVVAPPSGTLGPIFVSGHTGLGVSKYYAANFPPQAPSVFLDVSSVTDDPLMNAAAYDATAATFTIGAAVSLAEWHAALDVVPADIPGAAIVDSMRYVLGHMANAQVRQRGTWAGNLVLAWSSYRAWEAGTSLAFPSDLVTLLVTANAVVTVSSVDPKTGDQSTSSMSVLDFLSKLTDVDTGCHLLLSLTVPLAATESAAAVFMRSYKVMQRHTNSHALVNAGFRIETVGTKVHDVRIVLGNATSGGTVLDCTQCAAAFRGRDLLDPKLLAEVLDAVEKDMQEAADTNLDASSPSTTPSEELLYPLAYRQSVAIGLVFRAYVTALPASAVPARLQSLRGDVCPDRPESSGTLEYAGDKLEFPVSEWVPKLSAQLQVTGRAKYTLELPKGVCGPALYGALVTSTQPLATLSTFDASAASSVPGFVRLLTAADIPGTNDIGMVPGDEMLFVPQGGVVQCVGQQIGLALATSASAAERAARLLSAAVTYTAAPDGATPVLSLQDAISRDSLLPPNQYQQLVAPVLECGDVEKGLAGAAYVISDTVTLGSQKHFYMETQAAMASPTETGGLEIHASTQGPTVVRGIVHNVTGIPSNQISVKLRRSGGAFGGKLSRGLPVAAATAVAAMLTDTTVYTQNDRVLDSQVTGGREPLIVSYKVGVDEQGVIQALIVDYYVDGGWSYDCTYGDVDMLMMWSENAYYLKNYRAKATIYRTNLPTNTAMRAPGVVQSVWVMESVIEHISRTLQVSPDLIRTRNFYQTGQLTPYQQPLPYVSLQTCWAQLLESADYKARLADVEAFNRENRWRKRGISVVPCKYGISWVGYVCTANVLICAEDGTVQISDGGCEIGQGLHTKAAQVAAWALGVPLETVAVAETSTEMEANDGETGGSGTSESVCAAVKQACDILTARLAPYRQKLGSSATWQDVVAAAAGNNVQLQAQGFQAPTANGLAKARKQKKDLGGTDLSTFFKYFVWGAACSEVELDVLTGQSQIRRSDIVFDCGVSLNPAVDIGQVQGAFVQGIGYLMTENVVTDPHTGRLLSNGTWDYKPPAVLDIPAEFNVSLLKDAPNPDGFLKSKASGEPPYALSNSVFFACKHAMYAAREDAQISSEYRSVPVPATVVQWQTACGVEKDQMVLE